MAAAAVLSPTLTGNVPVEITSNPPDTSNGFDEAAIMTGSELLVARMSSVLQSLGYNGDTIKQVGSRVTANIVSSTIDLGNASTGSIPDIGRLLDNEILNREKLQSRNLYLNSNEPVLLLEIPAGNASEKSTVELSQLKDDFIELLRARSVRPVRAYVRETTTLDSLEFGFCLLNVVNTDIGGPGMVQLLDAAFHNEGWKKDLILKEAYDGHNLLWRDEVVAQSLNKSVSPIDTVILDEHLSESETISTDNPAPEQQAVETGSAAEIDVDKVEDGPEDTEKIVEEHPAMAELRQWESARRDVQHPTWSRDREDDLLDIIKTHSASIRDEEAAGTEPVSEAASDDFELVNKV